MLLVLLGGRLPRRAASMLGTVPAGLAAALAVAISADFLLRPPAGDAVRMTLGTWIDAGDAASGTHFLATAGLYLDPLAVVMMLVVTVVGFMILVYSTSYMAPERSTAVPPALRGDAGVSPACRADILSAHQESQQRRNGKDADGTSASHSDASRNYARFFAYMNLFMAAMLVLVLADNLLFFYLGWEGVGLCSYLLISFWYTDPANVAAGRKAFLVTRVGDTALLLGILLIFAELGTLDIQGALAGAAAHWPTGSALAVGACLLLLAGALGKSAQLPLQTWLPDAMAGPTPTSALIHAATMVTAGVYLLARMDGLMALAPAVRDLTAAIGGVTLIISGLSALFQRDIKRVLAYSTISQVGYMFLAVGIGSAWSGVYHLITHAAFKSLLFLGAGAIILAMHHEQDMFKMGGLRKKMPLVFWTFLFGAAGLSALPLITSGDYSKDAMLEASWMLGTPWGRVLWAVGTVGAVISTLYTFRMIFIVFFGKPKNARASRSATATDTPVVLSRSMSVPLVILAVLTVGLSVLQLPRSVAWMVGKDEHTWLSGFLYGTFHVHPNFAPLWLDATLLGLTGAASMLGLWAAWWLYVKRPEVPLGLALTGWGAPLRRFWMGGAGFDWLYDRMFARPFVAAARTLACDWIDLLYRAVAEAMTVLHFVFAASVSGRLRWYALAVVFGAFMFLLIVVLR